MGDCSADLLPNHLVGLDHNKTGAMGTAVLYAYIQLDLANLPWYQSLSVV